MRSSLPTLAGGLLAVALLWPLGVAAEEPAPLDGPGPVDFETLYRSGREARAAGDSRTAIEKFEQAAELQPENGDAQLLLGLSYSAEQRFEEALDALGRALALAPKSVDARLAIARIRSWQGNYTAAAARADAVIADDPDNFDAVTLRARIALWQQDFATAERGFARASVLAPDDAATLIALGDVKAALGDDAAARRHYQLALHKDPGSTKAAKRLARRPIPDLSEALAADDRWRLDVSYIYSSFKRAPREPWQEVDTQISYAFGQGSVLHVRSEVTRRPPLTDTYYQIGIDHRFRPWLSGYAHFGGTPRPDFRPRHQLLTGAAVRLWPGRTLLGPTLATLDLKWSRVLTGTVQSYSPGLQQYFFAGRVWLTVRRIITDDETGARLMGWLARIDWQIDDMVRIHFGLGKAPETSANRTVDTTSYFAGLAIDLTRRFGIRLGLVRDDRENSYIRDAVSVSLVIRF